MSGEAYLIERFVDLLLVPSERRQDCVMQLLMGLELSELADVVVVGPLEWTDDGDASCVIADESGAPWLTLEMK